MWYLSKWLLHEVEQCSIYKCSHLYFASYLQCTLYTDLQDTYSCPPNQQQFCPVCICWNSQRVCLVESCLGPLGVDSFSSHCNLSKLESVTFWIWDIHDLATSCRKILYCIFCVLYTKKKSLMIAHLSRYSSTFIDHLTAFSELSNNWGTDVLSTSFLNLFYWTTVFF